MWQQYNPNPRRQRNGDCAVRAIAAALGVSWDEAYIMLSVEGFEAKDLPNADNCWGACLQREGFSRDLVQADCTRCYTVRDFAAEHPKGTYVLGCDGHVIAIVSGDWMDAWDSGDERPIFYWHKEE